MDLLKRSLRTRFIYLFVYFVVVCLFGHILLFDIFRDDKGIQKFFPSSVIK